MTCLCRLRTQTGWLKFVLVVVGLLSMAAIGIWI